MKDMLVGSTGFVGRNLLKKHAFSIAVHSMDINNAYMTRPDICIYAGVPSAMYLANAYPEADMQIMKQARENLRKILPERLVLISTVALYSDCQGVDEDFKSNDEVLSAYGKNRLQLERWVLEDHSDVQIIRLPALYGLGLKKNFLYDLHHIIPSTLTTEKYEEICRDSNLVRNYYMLSNDGYYILDRTQNLSGLKVFFSSYRFNALSFTDSRSRYQFYNLDRLWEHINVIMEIEGTIVNLVTPPVSTLEIYKAVTESADWENKLNGKPYDYDIKTKYDSELGGGNGYICDIDQEIKGICQFMKEWDINEA